MSVTFDESPMSMPSGRSTASGLSGFLIRHGLAKTTTGAQALLAIFALIMFGVTFMLISSNFKSSSVDTSKNIVPVNRR